jgi:hypothetical protein
MDHNKSGVGMFKNKSRKIELVTNTLHNISLNKSTPVSDINISPNPISPLYSSLPPAPEELSPKPQKNLDPSMYYKNLRFPIPNR